MALCLLARITPLSRPTVVTKHLRAQVVIKMIELHFHHGLLERSWRFPRRLHDFIPAAVELGTRFRRHLRFSPCHQRGLAGLVGLISALLAKATDLLGSREMPRSANPDLALLDAQAD
jgi:hypothetical protein